jgi:predicted ATPase
MIHLRRVALRTAERAGEDRGFPFDLPALRETTALEFTAPVRIFVGENGSGESTLLEDPESFLRHL